MDAKKVYVVTRGSYSDYHILAVFTCKEQAEKFAGSYGGRKGYPVAEVEEYDFNPGVPEVRKYHFVEIDHRGNVEREGSFWDRPGTKQAEVDVQMRMIEVSREENDNTVIVQKKQEPFIYAASDRGADVAAKIARETLAEVKAKMAGD